MEYNKRNRSRSRSRYNSRNIYNNGYHMIPYYNDRNNEDNDYEIDSKYSLSDIESDKGWNIVDLETLYEIGFRVKDEGTMQCEVESVELDEIETTIGNSKKCMLNVYKTNEGYVLKSSKPNRRYVFETFNMMLDFIEKQ